MIYGFYKVKNKNRKFFFYIGIFICIAIVAGIFVPLQVREVPRLTLLQEAASPVLVSAENAGLTFHKGHEVIQAPYEIKKNIEDIVKSRAGFTTAFARRENSNEYLFAFSNGEIYVLAMEERQKSAEEKAVLTRYVVKLANIPIAAVWYGVSVFMLSSDEEGRAFGHMLKKNKRNNSLKVTKTFTLPFFAHGDIALQATSHGVFIHAGNTVYVLKNDMVEIYEKNVCGLSSVWEQKSFLIATLRYAIDSTSCRSSSASPFVYSHPPMQIVEKQPRIIGSGLQWNLFPLVNALSIGVYIRLKDAGDDYAISRDKQYQFRFSYTYGEKHYTIAIR